MSSTVAEPSWIRRHTSAYRAFATLDFKSSVQYRWPTLLGMLALLTEPVVYLAVWSAVADQGGGTVGGLTAGQISAYYVVWTLVRNLTAGYAPSVWEMRFRDGTLADLLMRPIHPVHADIAGGYGFNLIRTVIALPQTVLLVVVFRPELSPRPVEIVVFVISIAATYLLRALLFCAVGAVGFWTTRVDAVSRVYLAFELLLSGRLVPIVFFSAWLATLCTWLPFRYTFGFPIEVLTTSLSTGELWAGLATQIAWIAASACALAVIWRFAIRRFDAVGI